MSGTSRLCLSIGASLLVVAGAGVKLLVADTPGFDQRIRPGRITKAGTAPKRTKVSQAVKRQLGARFVLSDKPAIIAKNRSIAETTGGGTPRGPGIPNDNCGDAILVSVPSETAGSTAGAGVDNQFGNCGTSIDSPGIWYRVMGTGNTLTATTCNAISDYDTKISVFCGDCEQMFCAGGIDDDCDNFDGVLSTFSWCSAAGQEYLILVHGFGGDFGDFRLDISDDGVACNDPPLCSVCVVECPAQSVNENEANCGIPEDTTNGGCNSSPPVFTSIECGQTICGTAAANDQLRDTDWYQVVLAAPSQITWTVRGTFDLTAGIVDNGGIPNCAGVSDFLVADTVGPCSDASVTVCLPAGTYWLFVGPEVSATCGALYTASLTCEACPEGACCFRDGSCQGGMDALRCDAAAGRFQGGGTSCQPNNCLQPAGNDDCATATLVGVPSSTQSSTFLADPEAGFTECGTPITAPGVWYRVIGNGNDLVATTCNEYSNYDTKLSVFCGNCDDPVCITGADDDFFCFPLTSVSWCSQPGAEYFILVHGFEGGVGDFQLDIIDSGAPCNNPPLCLRPGNDDCSDAVSIQVPSSTPGNSGGGAVDAGFPACGTSITAPGVWYTLTGTGNSLTATTCNEAGQYDSKITVFCGGCETPICIDGNDDSCSGFDSLLSTVTWCSAAGEQYYVLVHGFSGDTGAFKLDITEGAACDNPPRCVPCEVTCPEISTPENEQNCGLPVDTVNGGCNSSPPVFSTISCGQTICGTAATGGGIRDTDWYALELASETRITFTVEAEFDVVVGIVDNHGEPNCEGVENFLTFTTGGECQRTSVSECLPAGNWWFFVAPTGEFDVSCGARYFATAECGPCNGGPAGACCLAGGQLILNWETDAAGNPLPAGTVITNQYEPWGVFVTMNNNTSRHPDKAVIFDSANPSGEDTDLRTPGSHASNNTPYDNILIIAENETDANSDGLVDDPDDEANRPAGWINFRFSTVYDAARIFLVDVDPGEPHSVSFFLAGGLVGNVPVAGGGDGSVVEIAISNTPFDEIRWNAGGSGAIAEIRVSGASNLCVPASPETCAAFGGQYIPTAPCSANPCGGAPRGGQVEVHASQAGAHIGVNVEGDSNPGGGFADFKRTYPIDAKVTLTAPDMVRGRPFIQWRVDGILRPADLRTIDLTVTGDHRLEAAFASFKDCDRNDVNDFQQVHQDGVSLYLPQMVDAMLTTTPDPVLICMLDQNGDGLLTGLDIPDFVQAILAP